MEKATMQQFDQYVQNDIYEIMHQLKYKNVIKELEERRMKQIDEYLRRIFNKPIYRFTEEHLMEVLHSNNTPLYKTTYVFNYII